MVRCVEGFRAELDVAQLAQRNGLQKPKVDFFVSQTLNGVQAYVAERTSAGF
jgi:hypothetical protein